MLPCADVNKRKMSNTVMNKNDLILKNYMMKLELMCIYSSRVWLFSIFFLLVQV